MNSFQIALDKYLTTPPNDDYSDYCEAVCERVGDEFFDRNETWLMDDESVANTWMWKLFIKEIKPSVAAMIVERAHKLYKL